MADLIAPFVLPKNSLFFRCTVIGRIALQPPNYLWEIHHHSGKRTIASKTYANNSRHVS